MIIAIDAAVLALVRIGAIIVDMDIRWDWFWLGCRTTSLGTMFLIVVVQHHNIISWIGIVVLVVNIGGIHVDRSNKINEGTKQPGDGRENGDYHQRVIPIGRVVQQPEIRQLCCVCVCVCDTTIEGKNEFGG